MASTACIFLFFNRRPAHCAQILLFESVYFTARSSHSHSHTPTPSRTSSHCAQFSLTLTHSHTRTPHTCTTSRASTALRTVLFLVVCAHSSRLRLRIMEPCMGHTLAGTLDMMRNARQWDHPAAGDIPELRAVPHSAFQSQYYHNGNQVGFPCTHCPPCLVLTSGLCINRRIVRCLVPSLEWTCF